MEVAELGLDEMIEGNGVVAVEWAERWGDCPPHAWIVRIADEGNDERRIEIERG